MLLSMVGETGFMLMCVPHTLLNGAFLGLIDYWTAVFLSSVLSMKFILGDHKTLLSCVLLEILMLI